MRILLVHNPSAGRGDHDPAEILRWLDEQGLEAECIDRDDDGLAARLAVGWDLVLIAGGDGTVATVLAALPCDRGRAPAVSILPLGTANNLAQAVGIRGDSRGLIAGLRNVDLVPLDTGRVVVDVIERRFFESVGIGAMARAIDQAEERPDAGDDTIAAGREAMIDQLKRMHPIRLTITREDATGATDRRERDLLMLEVALIPAFGPRLRLAPAALPDDGWLHLVTLAEDRRADMLAWLAAPDRGPAPVAVERVRRVGIGFGGFGGIRWRRDDELQVAARSPSSIRASIDPAAVTVLRPVRR